MGLPMLHRLRPADTSDFEWLLALDRTSMRPHVERLHLRWDDADHRARFTQAFASRSMTVVEVEDEPVGMISVAEDEDPIVLHDVQLVPHWQGRGLGTRLVHDVLLDARARQRAVELRVVRSNPARALYERLGFGVVTQTDEHVRMRWQAGPATDPLLEAAMSPWADPGRRRAWVHRLFDAPPEGSVGFIRFVAGRYQLPAGCSVLEIGCGPGRLLRLLAAEGLLVTGYEPDPDLHAAAIQAAAAAGSRITVVHGGWGDLETSASPSIGVAMIVAMDGSLWRLLSHRDRVDAIQRVRRALRPGGVLVLEGPNVPWTLQADGPPPARTELYHRAAVSQIPTVHFDFHDGVIERRDTYVVEAQGEVLAEWDEHHRQAMLGLPSIRLALEQGGLPQIETFRDLDATGPARVTGRRIVLTARA